MRISKVLVVCLVAIVFLGVMPAMAFTPVKPSVPPAPEPRGTRTVVVEAFTATWCGYCTYESQALHQLEGEYSRDQVAIAEWHSGDNWEPVDGSKSERYNYYGVQGIPTVVFDGQNAEVGAGSKQDAYNAYKPKIDAALAKSGEVTINQSSSISGTTVNVDITIDAEQKSGTFTLRVLLLENVETVDQNHNIDWVVWRQLLKKSVTLTAGQKTTESASGTINSGWDQNKLYTIAFVQDDNTKVILNGNFLKVGSGGGGGDTQPPQISNVQHTPASPTDQDQVTVSATITDNVGVSSATLYYDDGSGSRNTAMTGSGSSYSAKIGPFAAGKTVTYHVEAKDAAGNTAKSSPGSFTVTAGGDKEAPQVSNVQHTPATPTDADSVTITATITDNVGVTSATVYYNDGSGLQNKAMTGSGSSYSADIGKFAAGKTVSYYVEAKDAAGNTGKSPSGSFTVVPQSDTQKPVISAVSHTPSSPTPDDEVKVTATITDNVGVASAEVKYDDGSGVKTASMTKGSGNEFTAVLGKFAGGVTVTYHVEAKDAAGNMEKSADMSFTVTASGQPPDVTVKSIQISPSSPKVGNKVTITATIENIGTGEATNVKVVFTIEGTPIEKSISSISAGGSSTVQAEWTPQSDGEKEVKVEASVAGDANPNNNVKTSMITVSKSGGTGTGTGSSEMMIWLIPLIVIVVVVVVLLVLLMRRKKPAQQYYMQQDMYGQPPPQW